MTAPAATFGGSWTKTVTSGPNQLHGKWGLHVGGGRFYVVKLPLTGHAVDGTVLAAGSKLTFTDRSGPLACSGSQKTGTYTHTVASNGSLHLTAIKDTCAGRKLLLSGSAWSPKK